MDIHYQKLTAGYLDITFHPKWDYIAITRVYIENFLVVNMTERLNIHKASIAASELLENATKYSTDPGIRMILKKSGAENEIVMSVFNKTNRDRADALVIWIDEMNKNDSFEFYVFRMRQSVKEDKSSSKLGLARIYHECQAKVSASYDKEEGVMEVRAVFRI
jgi:hypothetical protein